MSTYSRLEIAQSVVSWHDLIFPAQAPPRAVSTAPPFCPVLGYGSQKLRNWNLARSNTTLFEMFLGALLEENGFYEFNQCVRDAALAA